MEKKVNSNIALNNEDFFLNSCLQAITLFTHGTQRMEFPAEIALQMPSHIFLNIPFPIKIALGFFSFFSILRRLQLMLPMSFG